MSNREFKFRLWDKKEKKFTDVLPSFVWDSEKRIFEFGWSFYQLENYTIQQFTGMEDKEGKEIYEGDILQRPCAISDYMFKYTCEWSDEESAFMLRKNWDGGMKDFLPDFIKSLEVVGNIFENPESLK